MNAADHGAAVFTDRTRDAMITDRGGRGVEVDAGERGAVAQVEGDVGRW
ncbi:hypothetical protein [Sorangium sp. So ce381]